MNKCDFAGNRIVNGEPVKDRLYCREEGCYKKPKTWYGFCTFSCACRAGIVDSSGDLVATGPPAGLHELTLKKNKKRS